MTEVHENLQGKILATLFFYFFHLYFLFFMFKNFIIVIKLQWKGNSYVQIMTWIPVPRLRYPTVVPQTGAAQDGHRRDWSSLLDSIIAPDLSEA